MGRWNPLVDFDVKITEGATDVGPPVLTMNGSAKLEDGREVRVYLIPRYDSSFRTTEGYNRCYDRASELEAFINKNFERIGFAIDAP